jgi:hypothetical protein
MTPLSPQRTLRDTEEKLRAYWSLLVQESVAGFWGRDGARWVAAKYFVAIPGYCLVEGIAERAWE